MEPGSDDPKHQTNIKPDVKLVRLGNGEYAGKIEAQVPNSAEIAWSRISDLDNLYQIIPFCEHSTTKKIDENSCELTIRVGLPWPFPQVRYVVRSTLDHDLRQVSWTRISGNLKRNDGLLRFDTISDKSCRAYYDCTIGVGFHVPRLGEKVMQKFILPQVIKKLVKKLSD
ncbi:MAG: SRPBCC family protein [Planctomycetota bacterium]|nr:SRPBCC family protein [Planctomycetota bacterium]